KSLCLHDPVWYDHLPYLPFPDNWPVFAPKDKIGDWLEMYTKVMELNYWSSTTVESASFDEAAGHWDVQVTRDGERLTLHPTELVFATGMSGKARMPQFPGMDRFRGEQQHSSAHPGPEAYRDKKVVVVGSNNSAHDICAALWENGADVTMVQRSSTLVVRSEAVLQSMAGTYSEAAVAAGTTTARADLVGASVPMALLGRFQKPVYDRIRVQDADFYARLEAAGFALDFGEDDTGMSLKYLRRGSGYYIDVGASGLVADGSVALARGQVQELTEDAVVLADGTALPADLVVYATGYEPANGWVADLVDQETADRLGRVWGLGSGTTGDPGPWEGELRNVWKPTAVPQLWFHGGNLALSRHYSLYLALQLKARYEGIPTPVSERAPVHHPR
ncbi:Predicted flavoprotein CzcO associated with the cation diffusion facilitator CzcD, partial [Klenkia soli]